jgi:biotin carboxyl carrier protein
LEDLATLKYVTTVEGKTFLIEITEDGVLVDGEPHDVDLRHIEPLSLYSLLIDNLSHELYIEDHGDIQGAVLGGKYYTASVQEDRARGSASGGTATVVEEGPVDIDSPMPGVVLEVPVSVGETMQEGEVLVVLESMKMRIEVRSPQEGVVESVHVATADKVVQGQLLITLAT